MNDRPGRVLRFAVTGALLGGGVAMGGCGKPNHTVNVAPTENPEPEPPHVNQAMETEPPDGEEAPEGDPGEAAPEGPQVNPGPQ